MPLTIAAHWVVWVVGTVVALQETDTEVMLAVGGGVVPPPLPPLLAPELQPARRRGKRDPRTNRLQILPLFMENPFSHDSIFLSKIGARCYGEGVKAPCTYSSVSQRLFESEDTLWPSVLYGVHSKRASTVAWQEVTEDGFY